MCLYTSAYLHITVVLRPPFETEFICSNRDIWLQEHCVYCIMCTDGAEFLFHFSGFQRDYRRSGCKISTVVTYVHSSQSH